MNKASRLAATVRSGPNPFHTRACFFHCTPVLERGRRTHGDSTCSFRSSPRKFNEYRKRLRKQCLLRNVSNFAEHLFESWKTDTDEFNQTLGRGGSWFRPSFSESSPKKGKSRYKSSQAFTRDFEFCEDDEEVEFETIFRSAFGGTRGFYWSFTIDDGPHYRNDRNSSSHSSKYRTYRGQKDEYEEEEYDSSSDYESPTASDRFALGLAASGPLNIDDLKNAYRTCALKWHPDRHQGPSKVVAEEKFKACSAAYQSLCHKLGFD